MAAAFALASGTVGAAMSGALSRTRAIALSYGIMQRPTPTELHEHAHELSLRIIKHLWENWGRDPGGPRNQEVDLYTVNIPLIPQLVGGLETCWAPIWRSTLCRLLAIVPNDDDSQEPERASGMAGSLTFRWAPDIAALLPSDLSTVSVGSDAWMLGMGYATVTPLKASFAEVESGEIGNTPEKPRLLKL